MKTGRESVITFTGSFHGRTADAISATFLGKYRDIGRPNVPGHLCAEFGSIESVAALAGDGVAAVMLEPIQSMAGVREAPPEFFRELRRLCDERGMLLVFDEVQTGVGRTGTFFAFEQLGVRPDAVTLAKGLANGLPIGCLLVADAAAGGFVPGDHASTFGGSPVACAAACAVCDTVDDELLAGVVTHGTTIGARLPNVRGRGLLLAVDTQRSAADVVADCLERGLLVGTAGESSLRLTPPLTLTADELDQGLAILEEVL